MTRLPRLLAVLATSAALVASTAPAAQATAGDTSSVTGIRLTRTALTAATVLLPGQVTVDLGTSYELTDLTATVTVNGVPVASGVPVRQGGLGYQRAWGAGVVSLTNFLASGRDPDGTYANTPISSPPNAVRVRYAVDRRSRIDAVRRKNTITFTVKSRYIDRTGKAVSTRRATIQVRRGGSWRTLKNLSLRSNGTATYRRSVGAKRQYRLLVKTTDLVQGRTTSATRKL